LTPATTVADGRVILGGSPSRREDRRPSSIAPFSVGRVVCNDRREFDECFGDTFDTPA